MKASNLLKELVAFWVIMYLVGAILYWDLNPVNWMFQGLVLIFLFTAIVTLLNLLKLRDK